MRFCLLIFALSVCGYATEAPPKKTSVPAGHERIKEDTMVHITRYDEETNSYLVQLTVNAAVGPLYASPDSLYRSISTLDAKRVSRDPTSIVSNIYHADKPILLLNDAELARRRAAHSPSN